MIFSSLSYIVNQRIRVLISSLVLITSVLFITSAYYVREEALLSEQKNVYSLFENDKAFLSFMENDAEFDEITFSVVTIKNGDNFWRIAKDFKVTIDTIIGTNPYIPNLLARVNQKIVVPSQKGTLTFVQDLEQIDQICKIYETDRDNVIIQNLPLFYKYYYKSLTNREPIAVFIKNRKPKSHNMTETMAKLYSIREMFQSPLGGRLSSFFGTRRHPIFKNRRFHNGIDIAVRTGTPVGAARGGRVISTGWMGGYGKTVVIQHDKGYKTLYGHLSRITVRSGTYVRKGRLVGRAGSTGYSTGPHLHFTLWKNGRLVNPLKILW